MMIDGKPDVTNIVRKNGKEGNESGRRRGREMGREEMKG